MALVANNKCNSGTISGFDGGGRGTKYFTGPLLGTKNNLMTFSRLKKIYIFLLILFDKNDKWSSKSILLVVQEISGQRQSGNKSTLKIIDWEIAYSCLPQITSLSLPWTTTTEYYLLKSMPTLFKWLFRCLKVYWLRLIKYKLVSKYRIFLFFRQEKNLFEFWTKD